MLRKARHEFGEQDLVNVGLKNGEITDALWWTTPNKIDSLKISSSLKKKKMMFKIICRVTDHSHKFVRKKKINLFLNLIEKAQSLIMETTSLAYTKLTDFMWLFKVPA